MGASSRRVLGQIRRRLLAKRSRCCWKPPPARSRRASSGAGLRLGWSAGKKFRSATRRIVTSACRVVRPMIPACSGRQAWKNSARSQRTCCPVFPRGAGGRCVDVVRMIYQVASSAAVELVSTPGYREWIEHAFSASFIARISRVRERDDRFRHPEFVLAWVVLLVIARREAGARYRDATLAASAQLVFSIIPDDAVIGALACEIYQLHWCGAPSWRGQCDEASYSRTLTIAKPGARHQAGLPGGL